ncbi:hypothetical protein ANCCAN_19117 [Ancylostoma caninum]|uniref:Uncharacterized protein n=1 Tax=Ancylostoma caninum TaxID=29170 RepID=A0A368FSI6_ANCCA|nr:hypothetical protein ANCCAN_19117 [Ancylostoma caninum]
MRDFLERHWTSLPPRRMLPMVAGGSCNISMRICRAFDQDLYNCTKVAEILRYARAAFVPAVSINQVRITPTLIKRLTKSVMESQVKVSQWHFGYGSISCGVEEMVNLLKLCKTGTLKIVVPFADIQFCEALSRHPFIQTINVVLLVIESSLMHEMSIIPMEKFTLEQLGRMLRIWEYKDGVFFLYMRPSQRLGKDVPFMLRCAEPNHRVIDGRHILTNYHGCQMEMKNENGALTCFRLDI